MGGLIRLHESEPFDGIDRSPARPGRGFFQDLPLLAERRIFASQPLQLGAFVSRQAIRAPSGVPIGLRTQIPNALRRRLDTRGRAIPDSARCARAR